MSLKAQTFGLRCEDPVPSKRVKRVSTKLSRGQKYLTSDFSIHRKKSSTPPNQLWTPPTPDNSPGKTKHEEQTKNSATTLQTLIDSLQTLNRRLNNLLKKYRTINSLNAHEQLNFGTIIFSNLCFIAHQFYDSKKGLNFIQDSCFEEEIHQAAIHLAKLGEWLSDFVLHFALYRVELNGLISPTDVCKVRSGIQFVVEEFQKICQPSGPQPLTKVLADLLKSGEGSLSVFDERLKFWIERGCRGIIDSSKIPKELISQNHWWWESIQKDNPAI